MQIIDRRGIPLTVTFGDLSIGEAFQDNDGDINIKTDHEASMYWDDKLELWCSSTYVEEDCLIIPLQVTYTFERKN